MAVHQLPAVGGVHATLAGATVDTVQTDGISVEVEVMNRASEGWLYVRADGNAAEVEATGTVPVAPGGWVVITVADGASVSIAGDGQPYSCTRAR